eukprot:TRINITY_DN32770_c0_g2_i1.p1 TRINITY_DN32770_c0_g2~~TRINITY_DN32770_c0_g2_i1.p1  ORF type:complete len:446 (-),score=84.09 TRINITY_DN32770_c0_g2_i1:40-1296(-)
MSTWQEDASDANENEETQLATPSRAVKKNRRRSLNSWYRSRTSLETDSSGSGPELQEGGEECVVIPLIDSEHSEQSVPSSPSKRSRYRHSKQNYFIGDEFGSGPELQEGGGEACHVIPLIDSEHSEPSVPSSPCKRSKYGNSKQNYFTGDSSSGDDKMRFSGADLAAGVAVFPPITPTGGSVPPDLRGAIRKICAHYFETNVAPTLRSMQNAQDRLSLEIKELRSELESQTEADKRSLDASEVKSSETKEDVLDRRISNVEATDPTANTRPSDPSQQETGNQNLQTPKGKRSETAEKTTAQEKRLRYMEQQIEDLRMELQQQLRWRGLGSAEFARSDAGSDLGSLVGSITGSMAGSIASSAVGSNFSKGIRDVRERLALRRQRRTSQVSQRLASSPQLSGCAEEPLALSPSVYAPTFM